VRDTFASNTSVTPSSQYQGGALAKIGGNLFDTVAPAMLRNPEALRNFGQPNKAGKLRDDWFALYQSNLIFGMGLVGGPLALWFFFHIMRRTAGWERNFWLYLVPFAIVAGVAVVGERDTIGVTHLTLLAIETLGVTLIAASFPWRRWMAVLLIAGCVVDFSLGIFLQAYVESLDNTPQATVFEGFTIADHNLQVGAMGPDSLAGTAWNNWHLKNMESLNNEWLGLDHKLPQDNQVVRSFADLFERDLKSDAQDWQGWYARNGGAMTFLGDRLATPSFEGWSSPAVALLLLLGGLLTVFWKHAIPLAPAATVAQKPLGKRAARRR
jgi:hypothetical protein